MPYNSTDELPEHIQDMSQRAQRAFMAAFNSTLKNCDDDEDKCEKRAFAIATSAAQRADKKDLAWGEKQHTGILYAVPFFDDAKLIALQEQLTALLPDSVQWEAPADFHMTLSYVTDGREGEPPAEALSHVPQLSLVGRYVESWHTPQGNTAIVLTLDSTSRLSYLQAAFYFAVGGSALYDPQSYRPHITLAYVDDEAFDGFWHNLGEPLVWEKNEIVVMRDNEAQNLQAGDSDATDDEPQTEGMVAKFLNRFRRAHDEDFLLNQPSGFKLLDGNRFIAWYTNAFKDHDGEWFTTQAIENDTRRMFETKDYPELWFYHIPGTKAGMIEWAGTVGRFGVALGSFDESEFGQAVKTYVQSHNVELSHGFVYNESDKVGDVYHDYHTFEISVLPNGRAANGLTWFAIESGKEMDVSLTADQHAALVDMLGGEEKAAALIKQGEAATKEAVDGGLEYKSSITALNAKVKAIEEQMAAANDAVVDAVKSTMADTLEPLVARMDALEAQAKTMQGANFSEMLADEKEKAGQASTLEDLTPYGAAVAAKVLAAVGMVQESSS